MRAHTVYRTFERRWQLPVYFQLRWKENVGKLEEILTTTSVEMASGKGACETVLLCTCSRA